MAQPVEALEGVARGPGRGAVAAALAPGQAVGPVGGVIDPRRRVGGIEPIGPVEPVAQDAEPGAVGVGDAGSVAEASRLLRRVRSEEGGCSF